MAMWNKQSRVFLVIAASLAGLAPALALAAPKYVPITPVPPPTTPGVLTSATDIVQVFNNIGVWVASIFWILAAILVFYAGFLYLTAGGEASRVERASHQLRYAVIAIIIGIMAYGLPLLVNNFLSGI